MPSDTARSKAPYPTVVTGPRSGGGLQFSLVTGVTGQSQDKRVRLGTEPRCPAFRAGCNPGARRAPLLL